MSWQLIKILSVIFAAIGFSTAWAIVYYLAYAVRSQTLGKTFWCGNGNGSSDKSVALTFDDGPSPDTLKILDFLRAENVKATFFLIGKNVEKYPEIACRIADEGHEIGNHSYSHPIYLFCAADKTCCELEQTQQVIKKITGIEPKLARPPCGVRSPSYFAAAKELGLQTIQWSDTGFDWKKISAERIAQNVLETVQADSIILLHDGDSAGKSSRQKTAEAVPLILQGLKKQGLRVAPLVKICPELNSNYFKTRVFHQSLQGEKQV